jgi:anaerobic selenocysteine-containing dehydrogenase
MYLASGSAFDTAGRRAAERFLTILGSHQKYTATTIDTPSKPLVAEIIGGWSGLTPIWDHESSKLLLLFGSNPVVSHGHSNAIPDPVRRFREFQGKGSSLWVIDPRRTETAALADHHLQLTPGTDWLVLGWLVRNLLSRHPAASTLSERTSGHEALVEYVAEFDDELVTTNSNLSLETLESLCDAVLRAGRVSALTGTGVSMSATANVTEYLLWALHILRPPRRNVVQPRLPPSTRYPFASHL